MPGIIGIRQGFLCQKGTIDAPQYSVAMGLGDEGTLEIKEEVVKAYQNEDLPSQVNFNVNFKTFQENLYTLSRALQVFAKEGGADGEVTTEKISSSAYGGVYRFNGNSFLGVDFEWLESMKERSLKLTGEVALPLDDAKTLIQSAIVNNPEDLNALAMGHRGKSFAEYKYPYFGFAHSPSGTVLCNGTEVIDRTLSLKTVGNKLQYNRTKVTWIELLLRLVIDKTKAQDLLDYLNKTRYAEVRIQEKANSWSGSTWIFGEGVLYRKQDMMIGKDDGNITLEFNKRLPINDFVIDPTAGTVTLSQAV